MNQLEQLRREHRGELTGGELLLTCSVCHRRALGIRLGDRANCLMAACLSPKCRRKSVEILKALGLPLGVLPPATVTEVKQYLGTTVKTTEGRAPASIRDLVYSAWLKASPVSKDALRRLQDHYRLPTPWIKRNGYGSNPSAAVTATLLKQFPLDLLKTVPGWQEDGIALNDSSYSGILIPIRDAEGLIVALKIRRLTDCADKMMLLSSDTLKAEYTCHVPLGVSQKPGDVVVVEGELKADYLWAVHGIRCVGIPGVQGDANLAGILASLLSPPGSVTLALDMDTPGQDGTENLIASLVDEPYTLKVAQWDASRKGPDDLLRAGESWQSVTALEWLEKRNPKEEPQVSKVSPPGSLIPLFTGADILYGDWPTPPYIVPDLIPTGLSLIAGKSKIGKSFFVLDLCISVATGSPFLAEDLQLTEGKVLYLAFEDTPRGMQSRLTNLMKGREHLGGKLTENLTVAPSTSKVPRMPGGMVWLRNQLETIPYRLVVIDTLERFRPTDVDGSRHSYSGDYALLEELKTWCEEKGVAVLLVHHVRKNMKDSDDIFDSILGSTGILGCPDTLLLLHRNRNDVRGKLNAAGREVQAVEHVMHFDSDTGQWSINPDASPEGSSKKTPVQFLTDLFTASPQVLANDVIAAGAKEGFSGQMLNRYKDRLPFRLSSKRVGQVWYWIKEGASHEMGREETPGEPAGD